MKGYITMSNKELDRLQVLQKVIDRQLKQEEVATQLNLSNRSKDFFTSHFPQIT